jgi:WD40 repeat protein
MRTTLGCAAFVGCLLLLVWVPSATAALDAHGDPLPPHAVARLGTLRLGPTGPHFTIAFTPDGQSLLTGCNPVNLCNVSTGEVVRQFDVVKKGFVASLDVSPDGKLLTTVGSDCLIALWDLRTGQRFWQADAGTKYARAVAFAPDGKSVVSGCINQTVHWWDVATGKEKRRLETDGQEVHRVAFTADGKTMATAGRSSVVRGKALCLWDVASGQQRWLVGHDKDLWNEGGVLGLAFSRDGKLLASAGADQTVRIWDVATGKQLRCLKGHTWTVHGVAFDPDGKRLVSAGGDATARVWDVASGQELFQLDGPQSSFRSAAFSPDGKLLATGGQVVRLWDPVTGKELRTARGHRDEILTVAIIPGHDVVTAGTDGTVRFWEPVTGQERPLFAELPAVVAKVAVSPDGRLLATGERNGTVRLWDVETGKELRRLEGLKHSASSLAFTRDGTARLAGGDKHTLVFWDTNTGKVLRHFELKAEWNNCWAITADGSLVAAGTNHGGIHLWNTVTGQEPTVLRGHNQISALDFSPDGKRLVSGDWSGHVIVWDVASGKVNWDVHGHSSITTSVAFSPQGHTVASGSFDHTVALWETATGQLRQRFGKHDDLVFAIAFTARGRLLVSAGRDCTGLVWDVTGQLQSGRVRRPKLSPQDLAGLWQDLIGTDAVKAHQAIWKLTAAPDDALPFLQKQLQTPPLADLKRLAQWIADLESAKAEVADGAARALEELGDLAGPLLREVLAGKPPEKTRQHMERLLKQLEKGGLSLHRLRQLRALEALEHTGGVRAQKVLQILAEDRSDPFLTGAATAALERSKKDS